MKRALITGITGQDGSYLSDFLLEEGYEVHGIVRRVALEDPAHHLFRIRHIQDKIKLHTATLDSCAGIFNAVERIQPDECYHLAAQSFVNVSFEDAFSTLNTNINGTLFVLSALHRKVPRCRFYFAASSEMFGNVAETPQTEQTPFRPRSAYGISKVAGFDLTRNYRETHGLFTCNGIAFNHESPRRGHEFVTRKITSAAVKIKLGLETELRLGNLDAQRDWGFSGDYVRAMWLMLQQDNPDDYIIATNETHTVREIADKAFGLLGLNWRDYVIADERFYRPSEVKLLQGDYRKSKKRLVWEPTVRFNELIEMMVEADLEHYAAK